MTAQPAHSGPATRTANDRFKASFDGLLWGSLVTAAVIHFGVFALWPEMTAGDVSVAPSAVEAVELPPDVDIPDAPARIDRPAVPVISPDVAPEATIPETTLEANPPDLLPPPPAAPQRDRAGQPGFTPYTVAPRVLNTDEVLQAMERAYPAILRDAGLGGTVRLLVRIDEEGVLQEARLDVSSGHPRLDAAAMELVDTYRFSPALNRDQAVSVWVSLPVTFQVRE